MPAMNNMVLASRDFTTDEKVWAVASLQLLKSEAEMIDDRVFSLKMDMVLYQYTVIYLDGT